MFNNCSSAAPPEPCSPTSSATGIAWKQSPDQSTSSWASSMPCSTGSAPLRYVSSAARCSPRPARMTRWSGPVAARARHWGRTVVTPLRPSKWPGPTSSTVTASLPATRRAASTRWQDWKVYFTLLYCNVWINAYTLNPGITPPARQEIALSSLSPEEPSTIIQFTYTSNAQMYSLLKRTAAKCSHISQVYSIGRSTEGRDLLVIEFTDNPGQHELCE